MGRSRSRLGVRGWGGDHRCLLGPLSWAQHWGAGKERIRSPGICALSPAVCLGKGAAPNPSQGCEVQTAHSAGDRCTAFFRILLLEEQRAGEQDPLASGHRGGP